MILLDTNALLWLDSGHRRSRLLAPWSGRLHISPTSMLELQFLVESGRLPARTPVNEVVDDDRWALDAVLPSYPELAGRHRST